MAKVNFEVDSALLSELGERLVGSVHVALLELIKNSYDADATEVKICIDNISGGVQTIIEDNGSGMTAEQVKQYWMKIATTHKKVDNLSEKFGRMKSGAKGIGRFSCRRLGSRLELRTTAVNDSGKFETTELKIDWSDFREGTTLSQIGVDLIKTVSDDGVSGTILKICSDNEGLFTPLSLKYIKQHSVILVANRGEHRRGYRPDPGFNISFRFFGEQQGAFKNLRDDLLNAGWGTVTARVGRNGRAIIVLDALGVGRREHEATVEFKCIKGAELKIGLMVVSKDQIRNKEVLNIGSIKELLEEWGGVFVRYNGVRVQPYGNPSDDWLNIDRDRGLRRAISQEDDIVRLAQSLRGIEANRYMLQLLSSRAYVGDVDISSSMPGFELKASREGFLDDTLAFKELRRFARLAIDYATLWRELFVREKAAQEVKDVGEAFRKSLESLSSWQMKINLGGKPRDLQALEYIKKGSRSLIEPISEEQKRDVLHVISQATDVIQVVHQRNEEELRHLRLVASTSVLLSLFAHEVRTYLVDMDNAAEDLKSISNENKNVAAGIDGVVKRLEQNSESFGRLVSMTLNIVAPDSEESARPLNVRPKLSMIIDCFSKIMEHYGIMCELTEVPEVIYTAPMLESEFYSIMINIMSNAIKAVAAKGASGSGRIAFSAITQKGKCVISCKDNGVGVDLETAKLLFRPYVSDPDKVLYSSLERNINKEHLLVLGIGSGLGLNIVKKIVDQLGGTVEFVATNPPWKTEIQVCI